MPYGPGTYGGGVGTLGPANVLAQQGTGVGGMAPGSEVEALSEIMQMLKRGEVGGERLMQVLAALAQATVPQMQQGPQQGPAGGQPSIQGLLG